MSDTTPAPMDSDPDDEFYFAVKVNCTGTSHHPVEDVLRKVALRLAHALRMEYKFGSEDDMGIVELYHEGHRITLDDRKITIGPDIDGPCVVTSISLDEWVKMMEQPLGQRTTVVPPTVTVEQGPGIPPYEDRPFLTSAEMKAKGSMIIDENGTDAPHTLTVELEPPCLCGHLHGSHGTGIDGVGPCMGAWCGCGGYVAGVT